jgi:hypothetical protein
VSEIGFSSQLAVASILTWLVCTMLLAIVMPIRVAILVAFLKVGLVASYFGFWAPGLWQIGGDDKGFFEYALKLYTTGKTPFTIFSTGEMKWLLYVNHSISLVVYLFFVSLFVFGPFYFSIVLFNVILISLMVVFMGKAFELANNKDSLSSLLLLLLLSLHPTMVSWSSFLALKEPLVATLIGASFYFFALFVFGTGWKRLLGVAGVMLAVGLFLGVRFYFPALIGVAFLGAWGWRNIGRLSGVVIAIALIAGVFFFLPNIKMFFRLADFGAFPYRAIHFMMQPAPWKITEPAGFLWVSAFIHWLMIPVTLIGAVLAFREGILGRAAVILVGTGVCFYGLVPVLETTRHRMPFDMMLIVMQAYAVSFWLYSKRHDISGTYQK